MRLVKIVDQLEQQEYLASYAPLKTFRRGCPEINWSAMIAPAYSRDICSAKRLLLTFAIGTKVKGWWL